MKKSTIILLLPLLFSCANQKAFPFSNLGDIPNFDRNGDLLFMQEKDLAFYRIEDVSKEIDLAGMMRKIEMEEDFFLLFSQSAKNCSHCAALEPKLTEFCFDSKTEVFRHEPTVSDPTIIALAEAYPESNLSILLDSLATPVIHFIDVEDGVPKASKIDFYDRMDTTAHFENFLKPLFNLSSVYHFTDFSAFSSWGEENSLVFVDSGDALSASFYHENLQEEAKSHDRPMAYLELLDCSEETISSFASFFGLDDLNHRIIRLQKGKSPAVFSYLEDPAKAIELIGSYFDS